ncbi:MAG TPA: response regulator [Bacteroidales bacterium]|nr:response regulator [Bacteroidales bacterium]
MEEAYHFQDKRILVVDDEEFNWLMIKAALEDTGVKVDWARVGQEAIDLVAAGEHYDLILMDMSMPVLDGFETTNRIKKINSSIPIIAQTAFAMPEEVAKCMEAGCDDYLSKPVSIGELLETIGKYL